MLLSCDSHGVTKWLLHGDEQLAAVTPVEYDIWGGSPCKHVHLRVAEE